jgi:hypothetical protein
MPSWHGAQLKKEAQGQLYFYVLFPALLLPVWRVSFQQVSGCFFFFTWTVQHPNTFYGNVTSFVTY